MESDREIVERRILESGFASVHDFDVYVKKKADEILEPVRNQIDNNPDISTLTGLAFTFAASGEDENKCGRCDKLKEHHHNKKRDGMISGHEWCYDFLLDL